LSEYTHFFHFDIHLKKYTNSSRIQQTVNPRRKGNSHRPDMTNEKTQEIEEPHSKRAGLQSIICRYLHLNFENREDRNAYYFVTEMFWATFLSAAATFNTAYVIRLSASDQEIGYLSSIPALFAIFLSIPVGRWLQTSKHKTTLIMSSLALSRFTYVIIALAPWLNFSKVADGSLIVWILILFSITNRPFVIGFTPMQSEVISPEKQGPLISVRMQIYHAVHSISVLLLGFWLDAFVFPLNYQLMYLVTVGLSVISLLLLLKVEFPEKTEAQKQKVIYNQETKISLRDQLRNLGEVLKQNPRFLRFMLNSLAMDFAVWVTGPLFSIFYVKQLGASDGWLGTSSALHSVCNIAGYALWRPIVRKYGEIRMLKLTALLRPLFPLSIALFPNLNAILVILGAWGILIPGLGLSHSSTYMQMLPPESREEAQSIYSTFQNAAAFVSPFIGIAVAEALGIPTTLIIFSCVRLLGSLMWTINPIDSPKLIKTAEEG